MDNKQGKYGYLRKFLNPTKGGRGNFFYPVTKDEIESAESKLQRAFPAQLREFYLEIGHGRITQGYNLTSSDDFGPYNIIFSPAELADLMLLGPDSGLIDYETWECKKGDELFFFEIYDGNCFLIMKPDGPNPNAVYSVWGELVEESFERFIYRLYYESPSFYHDVLAAYDS